MQLNQHLDRRHGAVEIEFSTVRSRMLQLPVRLWKDLNTE